MFFMSSILVTGHGRHYPPRSTTRSGVVAASSWGGGRGDAVWMMSEKRATRAAWNLLGSLRRCRVQHGRVTLRVGVRGIRKGSRRQGNLAVDEGTLKNPKTLITQEGKTMTAEERGEGITPMQKAHRTSKHWFNFI